MVQKLILISKIFVSITIASIKTIFVIVFAISNFLEVLNFKTSISYTSFY